MAEPLEALVVTLAEHVRERLWGKYRGTVDQVLDEQPPGQIVAIVPSVYGEDGHGLVTLPEAGDGVWIEFEAGDPSHPIWTGFWFANDEMPADAGPAKRSLITKKDLKLIFDDDAESITISHSGGAEITLDSNGLTLKFGDSVKVVLSSSGIDMLDGAFTVSA
jgi:hypothetical protein